MRPHPPQKSFLSLVLSTLFVFACGPQSADLFEVDAAEGSESQPFSSAHATLLTFEFDGELRADAKVINVRALIDQQMLFTIGHLNGNKSVGRLDKIEISNIQIDRNHPEGARVTYHVKLPVAWGAKTNLPIDYNFVLPKLLDMRSVEAFTAKYKDTCVDFSAHDVDAGSIWYYYRPFRSGCRLDEADVVRFKASIAPSTENTTGKYPEYHKLWEDNALNVVAIFGKYEDNATDNTDAGIRAYNDFLRQVKSALAALSLTTVPAELPLSPGVTMPDVAFTAVMPDGRKVVVTALLVDNVRTAGVTFNNRYAELSTRADLVLYNGHAGLGANVRALSQKGRWVAGQYLMLFMNGCDTFAYVDGSLAQARAKVNPDDPTGTKYLDIITNAMPAYFHSGTPTSVGLIRALMRTEAPSTYEEIFKRIDPVQIVVVTGEEDNVFVPENGGSSGITQLPFTVKGIVAKGQEFRRTTPVLSAGRYIVTLKHDAQRPGGDADLYVRVGQAPTLSQYDCRPYQSGSNEQCVIEVTTQAQLHINVVGYSNGDSAFELSAVKENATTLPAGWAGMDESGVVAKGEEKRFITPALEAGRYVFNLTGTGDADLYVRVGNEATTTAYDCRPYKAGSTEQCVVTVGSASAVHVMVRGFATTSNFRLVGRAQ